MKATSFSSSKIPWPAGAILSRDHTEDDEKFCTALPIHLCVQSMLKPTQLFMILSQVRDRRRARDEVKRREKERRRCLKEAWQEAERLVREGEREEGRSRRREERVMTEQMDTIRRQVREETERRRR